MALEEISHIEQRRKKRQKRKRRKKMIQISLCILLFAIVCIICFLLYHHTKPKPYVIGLDPGHGGQDVGAVGYIQEIELTEKTVDFLEERLKKDGRFKVIRSRKNGENMDITERKKILLDKNVDLILSIHGNSDPTGTARGFECYPSPPGRDNHQISYDFAVCIAQQMAEAGNHLRGINGIRYAYYVTAENGDTQKIIKETSDTTIYAQPSFAMVENVNCPAVLAEQCFLTNLEDVDAFGSQTGCAIAAEAYYKAICNYFQMEEISK